MIGAVCPFGVSDPRQHGHEKYIKYLSIRIAGGCGQVRYAASLTGGRSSSGYQAGDVHRVVQGFSMPHGGVGNPAD